MCIGSAFVQVHISQILLIWKNVFVKLPGKYTDYKGKEPEKNSDKQKEAELETEWNVLLTTRDAALCALEAFLVYNAPDLVTSDVAKRIVGIASF